MFHRRTFPGQQFTGEVKIGIITAPLTHPGKFFRKTPFLQCDHRIAVRQFLFADLIFDSILNITDLPDFAGGDKGQSLPLFSGTACTTDPVDVNFRTLRDGIVDHMSQVIHVDPPGGNVSSHQNGKVFILEPADHSGTQDLRHIAMEGFHRITLLFEFFHHFIHIPFGTAENQCVQIFFGINDPDQSIKFILPAYRIPDLFGQFRTELGHFRPDNLVILHELFGNAQHFRRHGGGKHQHPLVRRGIAEDFFNILDKTHIQHFISFIQHRIFEL